MPSRGQANIGSWPKSSGYSRCLGITWNAEATIGIFCSDFVVREFLHSLFSTTLFFPFSEENKSLIETAPSLFVDMSLTNCGALKSKSSSRHQQMALACAEKSSLTEPCTSGANALRPHEMRAQNGVTISTGAYRAPLFLDTCH